MAQQRPYRPWGRENVVVRQSGVHGRGLFATRDFAKGERIVEYVGERVGKREGTRRTEAQWERGRIYTFELNDRYDIDGKVPGNVARFANHSCDPNAESQVERSRIWIHALKPIRAGEEITYDYNFPVEEDLLPCRCGSRNCRGYVVGSGYKRQLAAWKRRHGVA